MDIYSVTSYRSSHLGFVHAANVDAAMIAAEKKWGNAYSVRLCPDLTTFNVTVITGDNILAAQYATIEIGQRADEMGQG